MSGNKTLKVANREKNDEFYTQLSDIENELKYYRDCFKGKTILCNCDDPFESDFFKYFALNFQYLGIKKLITTCYYSSPIAYTQISLFGEEQPIISEKDKKAYKVEITKVEDLNGDGAFDLEDIELLLKKKRVVKKLKGDGDFRSNECIELLKEADIIVTNPPFSLFREFIELIASYNKDFLIIGNTNALTYKEVFKLFQENRMRTGYTSFNVGMFFRIPDSYEKYTKIENGVKMARVSTSCWFTSLPVRKHNEELELFKRYKNHENEYPKYANFDGINVDTYKNIPCDYDGVMGVPITFLDKYNPNQFEIIGLSHGNMGQALGVSANLTSEQCIEYKKKNKAFRKGFVCYLNEQGELIVPYMRILIKRKGDF